jgi:hypothetical protein
MGLLDDDIKVVEEKRRKQRISRTVTWALLISLFFLVTLRVIMIIYYPNSWLAKHIFNW